MRRLFCDTNMGQVHVVTAGTGPATPLLLLHQTPRSIDEFAEVIPLLAKSRRVIAVDMPGYGCSDPVPQEILDMEKDQRKLKGEAFNTKEFLQKILSHGAIPLRTLRTKIAQ